MSRYKKQEQTIHHGVVIKNGEVVRVGRSVIYQPKTQFNGKGINWFDDSKLLKKTK